MKNQLFYTHEDDHHIMLKKDCVEIQHWVETLDYYTTEIDAFLTIAKEGDQSKAIILRLENLQSKNESNLKELSRYEITRLNAWECDDMACDSYYLNNHEQFRQKVMTHITEFRAIKKVVLNHLLNNMKVI